MNPERINLKEVRVQQGIELFAQVRNIPYRLGLDGDPNKMVNEGVGNCTRKHLYLQPRLEQLGYKVDIGIAVFDWRQLPIPNEIIFLLNDPIQAHMFLFVDSKPIDATWPPGIPGFLSSQWDGINATPLGVSALEIIRFNPLVFKARSMASRTVDSFKKIADQRRPTPFNDTFNLWLEHVQSQ
jgi:hypothetical protein